MPLTTCVKCGREVSPSALACPSCQQTNPKGVSCCVCAKRIPDDRSATVKIKEYPYYYCDSCIEKRFSPPPEWKCADCGKPLQGVTSHDLLFKWHPELPVRPDHFDCPHCGSVKPFGFHLSQTCFVCRLPVLNFHKYREWQDANRFTQKVHDFCEENLARSLVPVPQPKGIGCMGLAVTFIVASCLTYLAVAVVQNSGPR